MKDGTSASTIHATAAQWYPPILVRAHLYVIQMTEWQSARRSTTWGGCESLSGCRWSCLLFSLPRIYNRPSKHASTDWSNSTDLLDTSTENTHAHMLTTLIVNTHL